MEWASTEIVGVLQYLLPGLFTAWIFYGLTAHRRPTPFERIVQALIFTAIVQVFVSLGRWLLLTLGQFYCVGQWNTDTSFALAMLVAVQLGHMLAYFANNDLYHRFLRNDDLERTPWLSWVRSLKLLRWLTGITKRTSYPSEWFSAFNHGGQWILLHLKDGRRLFGWPCEWPDHCDSGHFVLMRPEWILEDNTRAPLYNVDKMLVPSEDVRHVDILKLDTDVEASPEEQRRVEELLIKKSQDQ